MDRVKYMPPLTDLLNIIQLLYVRVPGDGNILGKNNNAKLICLKT